MHVRLSVAQLILGQSKFINAKVRTDSYILYMEYTVALINSS